MSELFRRIADALFIYEDTCCAYVLKKGSRAVLFDCGSGSVLDHLDEIGVDTVDFCFHTHYHRHVCQGDPKLVEAQAKLVVPEAERGFFENVSDFWDTKNFLDLYDMRLDSFCQRSDVPVHAGLSDGETITWQGIRITALHTPGATEGSLSYMIQLGEQKILFCGDLLCGPANLWQVYEFQYGYQQLEGFERLAESIERILAVEPELVLPARGPAVTDPVEVLPKLKETSRDFFRHVTTIWEDRGFPEDNDPNCPRLSDGLGEGWDMSEFEKLRRTPQDERPHGPVKLSKHLWRIVGSQSYALVSDSGNVLVTDPSADVSYLHKLLELTGAKKVSHAVITHPHDDHLQNMRQTIEAFGTRIMALDVMADVLERPHAYNLPCAFPEGFRVSRVLHDGETFAWEEFAFTAHHAPGHTHYHMALFGEIDGEMVCFSGDHFVGSKYPNLYGSTNFRSVWIPGEHYLKTVELLRQYEPKLLLVAHQFDPPVEGIIRLDGVLLDSLEKWAQDYENKLSSLIAQRPFALGVDPYWVYPVPFELNTKCGAQYTVRTNIRDYFEGPAELEIALSMPRGFTVTPERVKLIVTGARDLAVEFRVRAPAKPLPRRMPYFVDVTLNGSPLGQMAEGVVNVSQ